jgi:hypothetical protein
MFQLACGRHERGGWEIPPSEFWKMTPAEWWLMYDQNIGFAYKEHRDDMDFLHRILRESKKQEQRP